jgi:hypothetical protein
MRNIRLFNYNVNGLLIQFEKLTRVTIPGADVIVRKPPRLIARHRVGPEKRRGRLARHEWLGLARDHIGAWTRERFVYQVEKLMRIMAGPCAR